MLDYFLRQFGIGITGKNHQTVICSHIFITWIHIGVVLGKHYCFLLLAARAAEAIIIRFNRQPSKPLIYSLDIEDIVRNVFSDGLRLNKKQQVFFKVKSVQVNLHAFNWLGRKDSNLRMLESKSSVLTT